jgi:hypothetical protein
LLARRSLSLSSAAARLELGSGGFSGRLPEEYLNYVREDFREIVDCFGFIFLNYFLDFRTSVWSRYGRFRTLSSSRLDSRGSS